MAKTLGADTVLVLPGCVNAEFADPAKIVDYGTAYDRSLEALTELKEDAEKLGVAIGLENVWNKFLLSPIEMRDFIDKIGSDFVLSLFGEPKSFFSIKNSLGEVNSYVNTVLAYDGFPVSVEGTWDLPGSYPFTATFRVVLEGATIENAGGKFMCYTASGAQEITIEKKALAASNAGGNISDLGGYYNELLYFTERAAKGLPIEEATVADALASLAFVKKEIAF